MMGMCSRMVWKALDGAFGGLSMVGGWIGRSMCMIIG